MINYCLANMLINRYLLSRSLLSNSDSNILYKMLYYMREFNQLIDHFINTNELGDFNEANYSITLYDIKNEDKVLSKIKKNIDTITHKYKFIVLSPKEEYTNIKILDINL